MSIESSDKRRCNRLTGELEGVCIDPCDCILRIYGLSMGRISPYPLIRFGTRGFTFTPPPLFSFISRPFKSTLMLGECEHEYLEPNEEEIVQCSEDYILFRVACIRCGMVGFAGGDIAWNPTYWGNESPKSDSQPHNPILRTSVTDGSQTPTRGSHPCA